MDNTLLERLYETVILPNYPEIDVAAIRWKDHGKIGPDTWAHYFDNGDGVEYVLQFQDYPDTSLFDDELSHELVKSADREYLLFSLEPPFKYVENITGYFSLYKERVR